MARPVPDFNAAQWSKASRSEPSQQCVEVAGGLGVVGVRDSKDPAGPRLVFNGDEWRRFVRSAKGGAHDLRVR